MTRPVRRRLVAACALWPALLLGACARASAEERLRKRIKAMQKALEDRKTAAFMAGVAPDFVGPGGLDHDGVRNLLRLQFLRHAAIGATLAPFEITMQDERGARVAFKAFLTGGDGGWLPDSARAWSVHADWRAGDGSWQVVRADWQPAF